MGKNITIAVLIGLVVWFGATIVRLESYHYANQVGFCQEFKFPEQGLERDRCLNEKQTRTLWLWHLLYGLGVF
jgi:hypothetical protein